MIPDQVKDIQDDGARKRPNVIVTTSCAWSAMAVAALLVTQRFFLLWAMMGVTCPYCSREFVKPTANDALDNGREILHSGGV